MLAQQFFQLACQMAGTVFCVADNGIGHDLSQEVSGPLTVGCRSLADGGVGGRAEGDVQQDPALLVRVVGGENVDRQYGIEPVA
ncbi:hypothetical protein ABT330_12795 [Streptomyces sp. NPDC000658]|uniref:Uncharacterized protein n=1 Tax=Streptomyces griseorubiginosus TaxID=67304 RepID=A0A101RW81_9ACTN|nr:hypothetical protein [Streptomyces griseorubiginosus]KUN62872.1 hypothetical protein AQJ54_28155 [Streptomyces griseorubiginosus]